MHLIATTNYRKYSGDFLSIPFFFAKSCKHIKHIVKKFFIFHIYPLIQE